MKFIFTHIFFLGLTGFLYANYKCLDRSDAVFAEYKRSAPSHHPAQVQCEGYCEYKLKAQARIRKKSIQKEIEFLLDHDASLGVDSLQASLPRRIQLLEQEQFYFFCKNNE